MGQISTTPEEAIEVARQSGDVYPPTRSDAPSCIKITDLSSKLSKEELVDRIKGTIYGNCIGDAIGLATEFMTKGAAEEKYGKNPNLQYNIFVRDFHRARWDEGDWTDDSDQMLLILDGIFAHSGLVEPTDFAKRLKFWMKHGFPELGDLAGLGIGQTVNAVVSRHDFADKPHECAKQVWERSGKHVAANGAVMRTSILGIINFDNIDTVISNTKSICMTTHADPRCIASCITVTTAIAMMLQKGVGKSLGEIVDKSIEFGKKELDPTDKKLHGFEEFEKHARAKTLKDLMLDDESVIGYTYKCFGSAFYCFRNGTDFRKSITELTMEAGDSDTNCAVAGALLGCKLGFKALPKDWLDGLKHKAWLDKKVAQLLELLGLE